MPHQNCTMKKVILFLLSSFLFYCSFSQGNIRGQKRDKAFLEATTKWFSAWQLVSKDIYQLDKIRPVEFVFFDDKYVYSTSIVTIKNGVKVKGGDLFKLALQWKKALHNDTIILPDLSVVRVGLMSFAAEMPNEKNRSFFVMPLPGYWKKSGVTSPGLGLENLVTGVFIHEFSHSQQMQNFGKKMTEFEKQNNFGIDFTDDIVQNIFQKDGDYLKVYLAEVEKFYASVQNKTIDQNALKEGLKVLSQRQDKYFKGQYESLKQIDNFFLTMEGLGQYSMFRWLTHPNGGNLNRDIALEGVRRSKKWWSQDEGFALFLILEKFAGPQIWAKKLFGDETESVIVLINKMLDEQDAGSN